MAGMRTAVHEGRLPAFVADFVQARAAGASAAS